jgi:hypothetical protein
MDTSVSVVAIVLAFVSSIFSWVGHFLKSPLDGFLGLLGLYFIYALLKANTTIMLRSIGRIAQATDKIEERLALLESSILSDHASRKSFDQDRDLYR